MHPSVSSVAYPATGSAFVARTQGAPIVVPIGATEDAATGGETPPGSCRTCGSGALTARPEGEQVPARRPDAVAVAVGLVELDERLVEGLAAIQLAPSSNTCISPVETSRLKSTTIFRSFAKHWRNR